MSEAKLSADRIVAGRYALFDEIGVGGMAAVHIGRLCGAVGFMRTVAIKRLHPSYVRDPEFVSMLIDEARLASRIRHPNVVQTLDVVVDRRELFVVMEYIHGESLASLLRVARERSIRIPYRIAVTIIADALRGLHAAHETTDERGQALDLVHRDISPQNLIVGTDGMTRVLDFGIAKSAGSLHVSQTGTLKGKFSYVAPEQIGDDGVDRQADVYSASVVLWEMLTGERLFHGDSPESTLAKVLAGDVAPPSRVASGLAVGLDAIVLKGLARSRAKRYQTAKAMVADLEKCCRLESHSTVAQWLEQIAADRLSLRAARIARIEREVEAVPQSSDLRELLGDLVRPDSIRPNERPTQVDLRPPMGLERSTPGSGLSGTLPVRSRRNIQRRRLLWMLASGALALVAAGLTWFLAAARVEHPRPAPDPSQVAAQKASPVMLQAQAVTAAREPNAVASPAVTAAARAVEPSVGATDATNPPSPTRARQPKSRRGPRAQSASTAPRNSKPASPFSNLGGRL